MSEFYIHWRAQVQEPGVPGVEGRCQRVVEELDAYPKVIAPVYEVEPGGQISFGFGVEGFSSAQDAAKWAARALRLSCCHASVGNPDLPDGRLAMLSIKLDDQPTVRSVHTAPVEHWQDGRW